MLLFVEGAAQAAEAARLAVGESAGRPTIVALDPAAQFALDQRGIAHVIPDAYCSEAALDDVGIGNFERAERFCRHVDRWLAARCEPIRSFGLEPAWYNYFALKRLFDAMTLKLVLLDAVLAQEQPAEVVYFDRAGSDEVFNHDLFFEESVFPDLIPLACGRLGVPVRALAGVASAAAPPAAPPGLTTWERPLRTLRTLVGHPLTFAAATARRWTARGTPAILIDDLEAADVLPVARELVRHTGWRVFNWRLGKDLIVGLCPPGMWRIGGLTARSVAVNQMSAAAGDLWRELSQDDEVRAYLTWNGIAFGAVVETRLRYVFTTLLVEAVARYLSAREAIRQVRPAVILFSHIVHHWQHAMIAAARQARVPVVGYQHGAFGERLAPILYYTECREPDYVLVYGEGVKRFIEQTYQEAAVPIAVGSPQLDRLARTRTRRQAEALRRRWGLDPARPVVVYCATQVYGHKFYSSYCYPKSDSEYFAVQARIVTVFRDFPDVQLIVKEHPKTAGSFPLQAFVRAQGLANCRFLKEEPLEELLGVADAFILDSPTTTFLEILTTDKPVLVFNDWFRWSEEALAALKARAGFSADLDEFEAMLRRYLSEGTAPGEPASDVFLRGFGSHLGDGRSTERAVAALSGIIARAGTDAVPGHH